MITVYWMSLFVDKCLSMMIVYEYCLGVLVCAIIFAKIIKCILL
ncbi:hypothetical protein SAMN05192581_10033 [Bacteroides ovatus]|uniref:Uncharacterized protein n=1 Tax=Bacteroides ovatus TaxID=28116 RepID=A0A1G6G2Z9_BACOV|nr:hypothetical protein SAMN05192581_10033 [Bacteroides ovatus]